METEKQLYLLALSIGCTPGKARKRAKLATSVLLTYDQLKKESYKAGYEAGFTVGLKMRPTKTLSKYKVVRRSLTR